MFSLALLILLSTFWANVHEEIVLHKKRIAKHQASFREKENYTGSKFTITDCGTNAEGLIQLLTFLFSVVIILNLKQRFYISFAFTLFSFLCYLFDFIELFRRHFTYDNHQNITLLKKIINLPNYYDSISAFAIFFFFFWQISILFRILLYRKVDKELLP